LKTIRLQATMTSLFLTVVAVEARSSSATTARAVLACTLDIGSTSVAASAVANAV
jgi:hypothetical protein